MSTAAQSSAAPRLEGPALLRLPPEVCASPEEGLSREWLETDGLGGYASSTAILCPTRRYHGLLVGRPPGSARRHVFLARYDEVLSAGGEAYQLATGQYGDTVAPEGFRAIRELALRPYPAWRLGAGAVELDRELLLVRGAPVVLVRYALVGGPAAGVELSLRPLLAFREADALTFRNDELDQSVEELEGGVAFRPYAVLPRLAVTVGGADADFEAGGVWYRDLHYAADRARGYPADEDQFSPGILRLSLARGAVVVAATTGEPVQDPLALWEEESERRRALLAGGPLDLRRRAEIAGDDFLYAEPEGRGGRRGVTAGFPWFGEWGRDTFLSLPGLLLPRGRVAECGEALLGAVRYLRDGLLPNVYGTGPEDSAYNSADAALWFVRAVRLYEQAGGSRRLVREDLLPACRSIADSYLRGTALGLRVDNGGLLHAGASDLNPTWMDAQTGAGPVTPREGWPVELQGLWYLLLAYLEDLAGRAGDEPERARWQDLRRTARESFLERFWLPGAGYLADTWRPEGADASVRPNMVLAAALEWSPLSREQRQAVVRRAAEDLLTPRGLRTLAPGDAAYRGRYRGGPDERDRAYHQGTVWPWLLGFYTEAALRAGASAGEIAELRDLWAGFASELECRGLGHVSEVFDGDAPHAGGGTIAQAWNTAEMLRALALLESGLP